MKSLHPSQVHRVPTFWPTTDRTTAIQVHSAQDAALVRKQFEGNRIAYSVTGLRLEVFEVKRSLESGSAWLTPWLPEAVEVYGGDASDLLKRPTFS